MDRRTRVGAVAWAVQPLVVVVELAVALAAASAAVPLGTLLVDRSISELGADRTAWVVLGGPEPVQSPGWWVLDVAFVVGGLLLVAGALLLRPRLPAGPLGVVVTAVWVLVGLSSAATGAVPLHVDEQAHLALSAPVLLLQGPALLLLGVALRGRWRLPTVVIGVVSLVGAVVYLARPATADAAGVFERLAVWPASLWLPVVVLALTAQTRQPGPRIADRAAR